MQLQGHNYHLGPGFHNYPGLLPAVDPNGNRLRKSHMPQKCVLKNSLDTRKEIIINKTVVDIRINGEITDPESRKILKKVGTLARIDTVILEPRFDYEPGSRDLRPFDRYAEPWVA